MIALSLIRPGPASGGMKKDFIERQVNKKPFKYLHPKLEKMLKDTYGVLLYQEDVVKIAVEVAGYTLAEANQFRTTFFFNYNRLPQLRSIESACVILLHTSTVSYQIFY